MATYKQPCCLYCLCETAHKAKARHVADALRLAVVDVLCRGPEKLRKYKEVLPGVNADGGILRYPIRRQRTSLWTVLWSESCTV